MLFWVTVWLLRFRCGNIKQGTGSFLIVNVFLPTNRLRFVFYLLSTGLLRLSFSPLLKRIQYLIREGKILFLIVLFVLNFLSRADFRLFWRCCFFLVFWFFLDTNLYVLKFNSYTSATTYTQLLIKVVPFFP